MPLLSVWGEIWGDREGREGKDFDTNTVSANVGECFQETFEHENSCVRISSQVKHVCTIVGHLNPLANPDNSQSIFSTYSCKSYEISCSKVSHRAEGLNWVPPSVMVVIRGEYLQQVALSGLKLLLRQSLGVYYQILGWTQHAKWIKTVAVLCFTEVFAPTQRLAIGSPEKLRWWTFSFSFLDSMSRASVALLPEITVLPTLQCQCFLPSARFELKMRSEVKILRNQRVNS